METCQHNGSCTIRVHAPPGVLVTLREPLLPFEARTSTAKFTGGRVVRKAPPKNLKRPGGGGKKPPRR